jgi:hypothetical protein
VEEVVVEEETEEAEGEEVAVEEVVEGGIEEVVVEEMQEVVVVTPLGSFLSNKTATDTAERLVPQLGNYSVPCRCREGRALLVFLSLLAQPISGHAESGNRIDCL